MRCHFVSLGHAVQLVHCDVRMFNTGTCRKAVPHAQRTCRRSRDIAELCCALPLPVLNMRHSVQAVLAQRNKMAAHRFLRIR